MRTVLTILAAGLLTACASEGAKEALIVDRTDQYLPGSAKAKPPGPNAHSEVPATVTPEHSGSAVIRDQVQTRPMPMRDVEEKPISKPQQNDSLSGRFGTPGMVMRLEVKDAHGDQVMCKIQFDYDSPLIAASYSTLLEACADFLKINPAAYAILQGNTDERGSRDYNVALGQKRAGSVYDALRLLGVPESQMEAVSMGEENPESDAHDENAWARNRRVEFFYKLGGE